MNFFRNWLLCVIGCAMAVAIIYQLLPESAHRFTTRCVGSLTMMIVILQPILGINWDDLCWSWEDDLISMEEITENYQAQNQEAMKKSIEEKTAAYILHKAETLGLYGEVVVHTQEYDGIPYPSEVILGMDFHPKLSAYISDELGIFPENQDWTGG